MQDSHVETHFLQEAGNLVLDRAVTAVNQEDPLSGSHLGNFGDWLLNELSVIKCFENVGVRWNQDRADYFPHVIIILSIAEQKVPKFQYSVVTLR